MSFDYKENGEKKFFLQFQSINIVYPNVENLIAVPITKRMEITMSIQVWHVSQININYRENHGKKKLFLHIQTINNMYPYMEKMIIVPITKGGEIITSIQLCLNS